MDDWIRFDPPKRTGLLLHLALVLGLSAAIGALLTIASQNPAGLVAILLLLLSVLATLALPLLLYRLYALLQSGYWIGRGGLRLRWGLRQAQLNYDMILDSALAEELEVLPPLPRWRWAGSVVGLVEDKELGPVEYLASRSKGLVLLGTADRVFVLSPQAPAEFLARFRREAERGKLVEVKTYSLWPRFVLAEAWAQKSARRLFLTGAIMALGLLILVSAVAPALEGVALGFDPSGIAFERVPSVQLFLLPLLNLAFFLGSFLLGLIAFRESEQRLLSHLLWGSSLLTGFLFLGAIAFIL